MICRDDGTEAEEFELKDATRFARVAAVNGENWSIKTAFENWEALSLDYDAGWLIMSDSDDDVWGQWTDFVERMMCVDEKTIPKKVLDYIRKLKHWQPNREDNA